MIWGPAALQTFLDKVRLGGVPRSRISKAIEDAHQYEKCRLDDNERARRRGNNSIAVRGRNIYLRNVRVRQALEGVLRRLDEDARDVAGWETEGGRTRSNPTDPDSGGWQADRAKYGEVMSYSGYVGGIRYTIAITEVPNSSRRRTMRWAVYKNGGRRLVESGFKTLTEAKAWVEGRTPRTNPSSLNVVTIDGQRFAVESVQPTSHGWAIIKARLLRGDRRLQTLTVKVSTLARQNPIIPPWPVLRAAMDRDKRRRTLARRRTAIHERVALGRPQARRSTSATPRSGSGRAPAAPPLSGVQEQACLGLVSMGYTRTEARSKVVQFPDETQVEALVRKVLKRAGEGFKGGMVD